MTITTAPTDTDAPDYTHAPLIERLRITGFQSLHDITLDLEPFTVIVGPSSSGKSALVRALRTLTNNARGTAYITHGFTKTTLAADFTDEQGPKGTLTLTRGTGTKAEHNAYVITPPDTSPSVANAPESIFTKLAGEVPPEVAEFMSLPMDPALTFAGQFDKPYLLDASPTEVARTLASLTNVHTIFNAAREANRVRLAQASTLRTRTTDLETIRLRTEEFKNLATSRAHQAHAEAAVERANIISAQIERLSALLTFHDSAARGMALADQTRHLAIPELPDPRRAERLREILTFYTSAMIESDYNRARAHATIPAYEPVQDAHERLSAYRDVLVRLRETKAAVTHWGAAHTEALVDWGNALEEYTEALRDARTCPTCGQDTSHIEDVEKIHA